MFGPIWQSSSVKPLVVRKLLRSFGVISRASPCYVLVYPSMIGRCTCVASVTFDSKWNLIN
jgi:hypothetical protein